MKKNRECRDCGKQCWGLRCRECFLKHKWSKPSRLKIARRYYQKKKMKCTYCDSEKIDHYGFTYKCMNCGKYVTGKKIAIV